MFKYNEMAILHSTTAGRRYGTRVQGRYGSLRLLRGSAELPTDLRLSTMQKVPPRPEIEDRAASEILRVRTSQEGGIRADVELAGGSAAGKLWYRYPIVQYRNHIMISHTVHVLWLPDTQPCPSTVTPATSTVLCFKDKTLWIERAPGIAHFLSLLTKS